MLKLSFNIPRKPASPATALTCAEAIAARPLTPYAVSQSTDYFPSFNDVNARDAAPRTPSAGRKGAKSNTVGHAKSKSFFNLGSLSFRHGRRPRSHSVASRLFDVDRSPAPATTTNLRAGDGRGTDEDEEAQVKTSKRPMFSTLFLRGSSQTLLGSAKSAKKGKGIMETFSPSRSRNSLNALASGSSVDVMLGTPTPRHSLDSQYDFDSMSPIGGFVMQECVNVSQSSAGTFMDLLDALRLEVPQSPSSFEYTTTQKSPLVTPPIIISAPTPTPSERCLSNASCPAEDVTHSPEVEQEAPTVVVVPTRKRTHSESTTTRERGSFRSIAETLQVAAKQVSTDQSLSVTQDSAFRTAAPFVLFLYGLAVGVLLPRYSSSIGQKLGLGQQGDDWTAQISMILIAFSTGMVLVLSVLRMGVWVVWKLGRVICDVDMNEAFRKGECVDSEGHRVDEAGLVFGGLFG